MSLTNKSDTLGKGKAQLDATISASGKVSGAGHADDGECIANARLAL